ncbi:hypothetical protein HFA01_24660 [Halobacillus faecis]|uniref:Uncharacterized protein n=1 Tax=Halobacillus faecis TaxID=360184 RepID=A0A511WSR5_9BACI|nr:hypothetical protein HFA01_24660 [Halobacillus faecis]
MSKACYSKIFPYVNANIRNDMLSFAKMEDAFILHIGDDRND